MVNAYDWLRRLHKLDTFSAIFLQGRQILWLPVCFPEHQVPSGKGSTLEGKNLLPVGANSFLLE